MFSKILALTVGLVSAGFAAVKETGSKLAVAAAGGLVALGASKPAMAQPVDLTALTAAVDFSTVITAVLAVAGILLGVYIAIKATKFVINMVKSG